MVSIKFINMQLFSCVLTQLNSQKPCLWQGINSKETSSATKWGAGGGSQGVQNSQKSSPLCR